MELYNIIKILICAGAGFYLLYILLMKIHRIYKAMLDKKQKKNTFIRMALLIAYNRNAENWDSIDDQGKFLIRVYAGKYGFSEKEAYKVLSKISNESLQEAYKNIKFYLSEQKQRLVVTPDEDETIKNMLRNALPQIKARNEALWWTYDPDFWKSGKVHFIIPKEVVTNPKIFNLFNKLAELTEKESILDIVFDINSIDNILILPFDNKERKSKAGFYVALYSDSDMPFISYCDFVLKILEHISLEYEEAISKENANYDVPALEAVAKISDLMKQLRAGLASNKLEELKFFLNDNDEIFLSRLSQAIK